MLRPSLRLRVLLLIVAVNVAVVGAETWVLVTQLARQTRRETLDLIEDLVYTLRDKLQPEAQRRELALATEFERLLAARYAGEAPRQARARAAALAWLALERLEGPDASVAGPLLAWSAWQRRSPRLLALTGEFERRLEEVAGGERRADARRAADELAARAVARLVPRAGLNVAPLLSWPSWDRFQDAVLLDRNLVVSPAGEVTPVGIAINPLGRTGRRVDLDQQAVYAAIARSIERGQPVDGVEGGRVVPIVGSQGVFGACWYLLPPPTGGRELLLRYVLPAFAFSTVLLTVGIFVAMRRFVLDPIERLARGARGVAAGDLTVRVQPPRRGDELARLIETFNEMTERVGHFNEELAREVERATDEARRAQAAAMTQRRLAAMGELAAGIAHEINNPLGGLVNAAEVLGRDDLASDKRRRYVELLSGGLERIRRTVGQLLRFTPRSTRAEVMAVDRPVLDAVALVRHRASKLEVEVVLSCGGHSTSDGEPGEELAAALAALPPVRGESHEIAQALLNLLVNALDALEELPLPAGGGPRGRVDVQLHAQGGRVVIEVRDDGPGIDAEVLERVSDLYFTTKAPGRGSGLGLAIVHNVVAAHHGRIELSSSLGRGLAVRIELPAADERG